MIFGINLVKIFGDYFNPFHSLNNIFIDLETKMLAWSWNLGKDITVGGGSEGPSFNDMDNAKVLSILGVFYK